MYDLFILLGFFFVSCCSFYPVTFFNSFFSAEVLFLGVKITLCVLFLLFLTFADTYMGTVVASKWHVDAFSCASLQLLLVQTSHFNWDRNVLRYGGAISLRIIAAIAA